MRIRLLAAAFAGIVVFGGYALASQTVTSTIRFGGAPITLTQNTDLDFGAVEAGTTGTYTVSTAGSLTFTGPGVPEGGSPSAANITIAGSLTQIIGITQSNAVDDGGVHLANIKCDYDGGGAGSCTINGGAAPGTGRTLLVGAQAVVDGSQSDGTVAHPTMDITVVYQ